MKQWLNIALFLGLLNITAPSMAGDYSVIHRLDHGAYHAGSVDFDEASHRLLVKNDSYLNCYDIRTGERLWRKYVDFSSHILPAIFIRGGTQVAHAAVQGRIFIYDAATGAHVSSMQIPQANAHTHITALHYDEAADRMYTGTWGDYVYGWDLVSGSLAHSYRKTYADESSWIKVVDDKLLSFSPSGPSRVYHWSLEHPENLLESIRVEISHPTGFSDRVVADDDATLFIREEESVYEVDAQTGDVLHSCTPHHGFVMSAAPHGDDEVVSVASDNNLRIWDRENCQLREEYIITNSQLTPVLPFLVRSYANGRYIVIAAERDIIVMEASE